MAYKKLSAFTTLSSQSSSTSSDPRINRSVPPATTIAESDYYDARSVLGDIGILEHATNHVHAVC